MRGFIGIIFGLIFVALGLAGIFGAVYPMMTHADPNGTLISLGGLGLFAFSLVVMLFLLHKT